LLQAGGGHAMAAGLSIEGDKVEDFIEAFEQSIQRQQPGGLPPPGIDHDGGVHIADLDEKFFADLEGLAPFGQGNPEPVLLVKGARFVGRPQFFGKTGDHLRGPLTDDGGGMHQLLAWKAKAQWGALSTPGLAIDALVRPQVDHWRGRARHQLVFVDGSA
jgi:single-stranded-DNA-specific exonuclease